MPAYVSGVQIMMPHHDLALLLDNIYATLEKYMASVTAVAINNIICGIN